MMNEYLSRAKHRNISTNPSKTLQGKYYHSHLKRKRPRLLEVEWLIKDPVANSGLEWGPEPRLPASEARFLTPARCRLSGLYLLVDNQLITESLLKQSN